MVLRETMQTVINFMPAPNPRKHQYRGRELGVLGVQQRSTPPTAKRCWKSTSSWECFAFSSRCSRDEIVQSQGSLSHLPACIFLGCANHYQAQAHPQRWPRFRSYPDSFAILQTTLDARLLVAADMHAPQSG